MSNKNFFVHSPGYRNHESRRLLRSPVTRIQIANSDPPESFIDQILSLLGSSDFIGQILMGGRAIQGGVLAIGTQFDRGHLHHFRRIKARFAIMPVVVGPRESSPSQPPSIIYSDVNVAGINYPRASVDQMIGNRFMVESVENASVAVKAGAVWWSNSVTYYPGGRIESHNP
ncbi:MAG: hypothetical protein R2681_01985 [Pyrinomonadaceae bacterium]